MIATSTCIQIAEELANYDFSFSPSQCMEKFSKLQAQFRSRLDIKDKTLEPWVYHDFMQRIEGNKAENSSAYVRETGRKRKETDYLLTSDLEVCNPLRREFFDLF